MAIEMSEEEKKETTRERYYRRKSEHFLDKSEIVIIPETYDYLLRRFPKGAATKEEIRKAIALKQGKEVLYVTCPLCNRSMTYRKPKYTYDKDTRTVDFIGEKKLTFHAMRHINEPEINPGFPIIQRRVGGGRFDHILGTKLLTREGEIRKGCECKHRGTGVGFFIVDSVALGELESFDSELYNNLVLEITKLYEYVKEKKPAIIKPIPIPEVPEWLISAYNRTYNVFSNVVEIQRTSIADAVDIIKDTKTDMIFLGDVDGLIRNWDLIDTGKQDKLCGSISKLSADVTIEIESESWFIGLSEICKEKIKRIKAKEEERKQKVAFERRMTMMHHIIKGGIVRWVDEKGIAHEDIYFEYPTYPGLPGIEPALDRKDIRIAKELLKDFIVPYLNLTEEEFGFFLKKFRKRREEIKEAMPIKGIVSIDNFLKLFRDKYREEIKGLLDKVLKELKRDDKINLIMEKGKIKEIIII